MIYLSQITKNGRKMPTQDFRRFCELADYDAVEVQKLLDRDGWSFANVLGIDLQGRIDMSFPWAAMQRKYEG